MIGLLRLEAGEFDHLSPLLGFLGDKLGEVGDRAEEKFLEWMSTEPRTWLVRNGSSDRMLILMIAAHPRNRRMVPRAKTATRPVKFRTFRSYAEHQERMKRNAASRILVASTSGAASPDEVRFFWSVHGVVLTRPPDIHTDGAAATLKAAKAEFRGAGMPGRRGRRWKRSPSQLASAELQPSAQKSAPHAHRPRQRRRRSTICRI